MTIRSLDLLDIPTIARYRNDVLTLDNARALTRGHPLGAMGLLAYINPARHLYAAISNGGESALLGGIIHTRGDTFAKLLYLAPSSQLNAPQLPALIEHLAAQAGEWQAFHVIAEVDETSEVFPALRMAGFSVYAWQRVWDASLLEKTESGSGGEWRRMQSIDLPAVQSLHYQIVPQLLHPVEPAPNRVMGFVDHETKCFANVTAGMYGIVLTPLIHPDEQDVSEKIMSLVANLPDRRGRPIYLNVRSYQAWLEPVLADLGAKASARQAVMVKHLARLVKNGQPALAVPTSVGVQPSRMTRMDVDE
ncbi:MAG: hypothetical protein HYZ21_08530 [Chloroflexi bacterium]|nr:hypothetical protein [Chloroflexota bacterium]